MKVHASIPLLLAACSWIGCGAPGPDEVVEEGPCGARIARVADEAGIHVAQGSALTFSSNPPATGAHYGVWAPWARVYDGPVPRGNWVHNLEHGGVALLYRCPAGCPEVVAGLGALGRGLPQDPLCQGVAPEASAINARWLLTPDPLLPDGVQVAAAAWGWTYRAACLDAASLRAFVQARYARAPEDTCADGAIAWPPQ
jgi:hypothetical protein